MVNKGSFVFCDTNICIYRTIALMEPPIYDELLEKVQKKLNELTNNNLSCKLVLCESVLKELGNNSILFKEVKKFYFERLRIRGYRVKKAFYGLKKSIGKFILKYKMDSNMLEQTKGYRCKLEEVKDFYLCYPEKLLSISNKKFKRFSGEELARKKKQRENNLPEEGDLLLNSHAIEFKGKIKEPVVIFSQDSDFVQFQKEIENKFGIKIVFVQVGNPLETLK